MRCLLCMLWGDDWGGGGWGTVNEGLLDASLRFASFRRRGCVGIRRLLSSLGVMESLR